MADEASSPAAADPSPAPTPSRVASDLDSQRARAISTASSAPALGQQGSISPNDQSGHASSVSGASTEAAAPVAAPPDQDQESMTPAKVRAELADVRAALSAAEAKLDQWQCLVEEVLHSALFSPEANDRYRTHASHLCTASLLELPQVTRVKHVRCSFPSIRREAPRVKLHAFRSLHDSEWDLSWAPSWSVDLLVEGLHYLYFELGMRIKSLVVRGRVRVDFLSPLGIGGVKLGFVEFPSVGMDLETSVNLGFVPVPVQDQIADIVRSQLDEWLTRNAVMPKAMHFKPFGSHGHVHSGAPRASTFSSTELQRRDNGSMGSLAGESDGYDVDEEVERAVIAALTHRMTSAGD